MTIMIFHHPTTSSYLSWWLILVWCTESVCRWILNISGLGCLATTSYRSNPGNLRGKNLLLLQDLLLFGSLIALGFDPSLFGLALALLTLSQWTWTFRTNTLIHKFVLLIFYRIWRYAFGFYLAVRIFKYFWILGCILIILENTPLLVQVCSHLLGQDCHLKGHLLLIRRSRLITVISRPWLAHCIQLFINLIFVLKKLLIHSFLLFYLSD